MMEGVVRRGTAARIGRELPYTLAGKTGTTNDFKDAWFVGFSPDLVAGFYIGFDQPRTLGSGEAGSVAAAPVFQAFMAEALAGEPGAMTPFRVPPGARLVPINPRNGQRMAFNAPGSILEPFKPGTEPSNRSRGENVIRLPGIDDFGGGEDVSADGAITTTTGDQSIMTIGPAAPQDLEEGEEEAAEGEESLSGIY